MSCKAQAFCQTDVNAGSPEDNSHATATKPPQHDTAAGNPTESSAQLRHQYVQALSTKEFEHLVGRIGAAHAKVIALTPSIPVLNSWHFAAIHLSAASTHLTDPQGMCRHAQMTSLCNTWNQ